MNIKKIGGQLISKKIRDVLLKIMNDPEIKERGKLPREDELAKILGVSRTSLRDALSLMETELFITRRRGIGTIINYDIVNLKTRLDIEAEFYNFITEAGYKPSTQSIRIEHIKAPETMAEKLQIPAGSSIISVEKVMAGDEIPLIVCKNCIPEKIIDKKEYSEKDFNQPIFGFLETFCNLHIHHEISNITSVIFNDRILELFGIEKRPTAGLYLNEVAYDIENKPIMWSEEYHRTDKINHTLVRKKI